jgi:hypothetical protein
MNLTKTTKIAVKKFQSSVGLLSGGTVGLKTIKLLLE